MNLKQLKTPDRSYYKFIDPTNGTFFLVYNKTRTPSPTMTSPIPSQNP